MDHHHHTLEYSLGLGLRVKTWKYWVTLKNHILISPDLKRFASLKREVNQATGDFPVIKIVAKQHQQTSSHLPGISCIFFA